MDHFWQLRSSGSNVLTLQPVPFGIPEDLLGSFGISLLLFFFFFLIVDFPHRYIIQLVKSIEIIRQGSLKIFGDPLEICLEERDLFGSLGIFCLGDMDRWDFWETFFYLMHRFSGQGSISGIDH